MHTVKTVTLSLDFVASLTVVGSVNQREQNKVLLECPLRTFECSHSSSKMVILHSSGVELHYSFWSYLAASGGYRIAQYRSVLQRPIIGDSSSIGTSKSMAV